MNCAIAPREPKITQGEKRSRMQKGKLKWKGKLLFSPFSLKRKLIFRLFFYLLEFHVEKCTEPFVILILEAEGRLGNKRQQRNSVKFIYLKKKLCKKKFKIDFINFFNDDTNRKPYIFLRFKKHELFLIIF